MKKISLKVMACLLSGSLVCSSCVGSFKLFNSYNQWQTQMTNIKIVNGIVGFILLPIVGGVTYLVDAVVLNTIEFWSGSNPMASNVGKTQKVLGEDGRYYAVKTLKDGYQVTAPTGEVTLFTYDQQSNSWSMSQNGEVREIFRFNEDGQSIRVNINGQERDFTLNEQGLEEARMTAGEGLYFAAR